MILKHTGVTCSERPGLDWTGLDITCASRNAYDSDILTTFRILHGMQGDVDVSKTQFCRCHAACFPNLRHSCFLCDHGRPLHREPGIPA